MMRREEMFGSIWPKTVVGLAVWVLMFGLGAALSGLVFFTIYQSRTNELEDRIIKLQEQIDKRVEDKLQRLEDKVDKASKASGNLRTSTDVAGVVKAAGASIARVEGLDAAKKPIRGSGFVVKSLDRESWVITNYHLVAGAEAQTLPVRVRIGTTESDSEVYATDPSRDLAILVFKHGGIRNLKFSIAEPRKDDEVWAVGAKATGFGATATQSTIKEVNASGLVMSSPFDPVLTGGPLLDSSGRVLGILSSKTTASSADSSVGSAVPIAQSCQLILRCNVPGLQSPSPSAQKSPKVSPPGSPTPAKSPSDLPATIPPESTAAPSNQIEG